MSRYLLLNNCSALVILIPFITASFRNHDEEKKVATDVIVTSHHKVSAADDLYVLEIDGAVFTKLKTDKWIFKFIHTREEALTLHGWYAHGVFGRSFDDKQAIELKPTKTSVLKYTTDMYFGDIILRRKDVRKIKKLIKKDNVEKVLFTPQLKPGTHVSYKVTLISVKKGILRETFDANPSPPKNFQTGN